jgi:hypothetical protein
VPARGHEAAAAGELVDEPLLAELDDVDVLELVVDSELFELSDEDVELDDVSPAGTVLPPLRLSVR